MRCRRCCRATSSPPDDIAEAIRALHDLGWVTGQILECDGGLGLHSPIDSFGEATRG